VLTDDGAGRRREAPIHGEEMLPCSRATRSRCFWRREALNLDGYRVIFVDAASRTVRLDSALLRQIYQVA
jgi:hypothetical protein